MFQVKNNLWIGNALDVRTPQPLFEAGIKVVVDLAEEELCAALPRSLVYLRFPLCDTEGNERWILLSALQSVNQLLRNEVPTLIGCSAGLSRSPTLCAFGLAEHSQQRPEDVLSELAQLKPLQVHPGFWKDVSESLAGI